MNTEFEKFINLVGGPEAAAEKLDNCSIILVRSIRNGNKSVSKPLAKQIIDMYPGDISLARLLFPDSEQAA